MILNGSSDNMLLSRRRAMSARFHFKIDVNPSIGYTRLIPFLLLLPVPIGLFIGLSHTSLNCSSFVSRQLDDNLHAQIYMDYALLVI